MVRDFLQIARDPRVIPGVHHYCDEWCAQCALTTRCLAYRCIEVYRRMKGRTENEPPFRTTEETIEFTRVLSAVEGRSTPELDTLLEAPAQAAKAFRTSDPLSRAALEYALGVSMWLVLSPDELARRRRGTQPGPEEVALWYHLRIYTKVTRAIITRERVMKGLPSRGEDAVGCAKLALVAVQRSRRALQQLRTDATASTVDQLVASLDQIERGIDERFPAARSFVRVGLDVPA